MVFPTKQCFKIFLLNSTPVKEKQTVLHYCWLQVCLTLNGVPFMRDLRTSKSAFIKILRCAPSNWRCSDDAFTVLTAPHHHCCHEESDKDWDHNERTQDSIRGVTQRPPWHRAVLEVVLVNCYEELIHEFVRPVAIQFCSYQEGTVDKFSIPTEKRREGCMLEDQLTHHKVLELPPSVNLDTNESPGGGGQGAWRLSSLSLSLHHEQNTGGAGEKQHSEWAELKQNAFRPRCTSCIFMKALCLVTSVLVSDL